jgi:hypothetical protein
MVGQHLQPFRKLVGELWKARICMRMHIAEYPRLEPSKGRVSDGMACELFGLFNFPGLRTQMSVQLPSTSTSIMASMLTAQQLRSKSGIPGKTYRCKRDHDVNVNQDPMHIHMCTSNSHPI